MASKKKAGKKKVLCINRFRFRYELAEDVRYNRKSPLIFTKDFVGSGSDDESCSYWRQLLALRSKPNWLELRGAFAELKNIAGNTSKMYRGFLLKSNFEPASVRDIGRWLGCAEKKAKVIVAELIDVELLDCVELPDFETETDDKLAGKSKRRKKKLPAKQTKAHRKSGRSRKRTENSGGARERAGKTGGARMGTGTNGKARAPLKEKANAKVKAKANAKGNVKVDSGDNARKINRQRQGDKVKSNAMEDEAKPKVKSPMSVQSQPSAEKGGARLIKLPAPSAVFNNRDEAQAIGDIMGGIKHRYSSEAKEFAGDIYQALKLTFSPLTVRGRRELGCFASLWERAKMAGLPPAALAELHRRAILEAKKVARRKSKCSNVSAVWVHIFERLVAAKGMASRTEFGGCG